jgi:hypothetical protein
MKINNLRLVHFGLAILGLGIAGCGTPQTDVEPLRGHYAEITYTRSFLSAPQAHQISLQYQVSRGNYTMIWPSVIGTLIEGDVALFVGEKASEPPNPENPEATMSRLFAVKAPQPPLDITSEVLWRWSQKSGEDFARTLLITRIVYPEKTNDSVVFHFTHGYDGLRINLDWNQIADIMREVKEKGVVRKDRVWKTTYVEFKPGE